jgi:hypothetical protein
VDDVAPLAGDWELWRSFAVRSAGFPVSGLEAFGPGDESGRLQEVARDPLFREAVTWQNPAAVDNAVDKVADGSSRKPSRARKREEIVASYWQRYCAKNDTIGFFGPLAWGRIDGGPPLHARSGALVRERSVHLESWGVQALAESIDPELKVGSGPWTERDLRVVLDAHPDDAARRRGLAALARLESARDAVDAAPPESLAAALAALDATFVELTGREAFRNPGKAYGARTLAYVDCMRDLDVTVGPALVSDLAPALQTLFEACSWYSGQVNEIGRQVIERSLPEGGRGPFMPVLVEVLRTLMQQPTEITDVVVELQQRLESVLSDPDPETIGERSVAAFADHRPAWRLAAFQSVDVQVAAPDAEAVAAGRHLAVIGDVHPGNNPLIQGVFAHRHPDPAAFMRAVGAAMGPRMPVLLPPWGPGISVDARGVGVTPLDTVNIAAAPDTRAQLPRHTWLPHELLIDGADLVDRAGTLRVTLLDAFALPIFVAGVRSFELLPDRLHAPRVSIGRTVLQRESWHVPAHEVPERAEEVAAFVRDRRMPRRLFTKSPLERKPMYLDAESEVLARILCRQARQAAAESPAARIRFTEMLPTPETCWLADPDGNRYVSELRLVAVDRDLSSSLAFDETQAGRER